MSIEIHDALDEWAQRKLHEKYTDDAPNSWYEIDKVEFTIAQDDNQAVLLITGTIESCWCEDEECLTDSGRWAEVEVDGMTIREVLDLIGATWIS